MGTKMSVSFANIFRAEIENELHVSQEKRNIILMMFSPFGTEVQKTWIIFLNELTNTILPLNS